MSEETDTGASEKIEEKEEEITPSDNPVVREDSTTSVCENESNENKDTSESKDEQSIENLEPPTVEGDVDDKWVDNYQFVEDEKIAVDYEEKDPAKVVLLAAQNNECEILRKYLEMDSTLVNARDNDLYTPLHRASYSNNVEVIRILLSYDADITARTVDGWEPLHCACKWDSVEAVSLLIQNGADVNAQTKGHITPLHLAASNVHGRRTLELLLWHPYIDPNIKNDGGDTAYDIASRSGPLGALFEILEESVNVY